MSGRPESLFPLFAGLETLDGVGPKTAQLLGQLDIASPRDVIFALPYAVIDRRRRDTVQGADLPTTLTVPLPSGPTVRPATGAAHIVFMSRMHRPVSSWSFSMRAVTT